MNFIKVGLLVLIGFASADSVAQNALHVNPMIGTKAMGHTFPGTVSPHGIVALSPDTDTIPHNIDGAYQKDSYKYCAGYQYDDKTIVGFSHTHFSGTGHSDLGDLLIMPTVGQIKLNPGTAASPESGYRSRFSHDSEVSKPGYYSVKLDDYGIKAELTATQRVGVHKYTFNQNDARIILDLVHGIYNYDGKVLWASVRVESPTLITGYRITNGWARENYQYFAIEFSQPIVNYGYKDFEKVKYGGGWRNFNLTSNFPEIAGRKIRAFFEFDLTNAEPLELKVALSAVSTKGALKNLEAETKGLSFNQIAAQTASEWDKELSVIDAKGDSAQLAMLYTSLYHTMINPSVYQDVDGSYRGLDGNIHKANGFTNYTVFSLWDTYRALHPLFNIINRDRNRDMIASMLAHQEQSVHRALPVWSHMANENWCMIGYHAVSTIADAIEKGVYVDPKRALSAMTSSAKIPHYGRLDSYMKLGYVPFDKHSAGVSMTLEYAYDDWTIYNTALKMGDTKTAEEFKKRAMNYKNVFDPTLQFARAKDSDGAWKEPFSLLDTHGQGFIEGNSWNYSFHVPHDVDGLIEVMGGTKKFVSKLDTLFTMHLDDKFFENTEDVTREGLLGNYVHGNEPSHHIIYLYNWTDQPWKTQFWVREVLNKMYRNEIDGLCGNDDCGQMSAWYIFSSMGFYPVCPGSQELILGAPYLPYVKLNLDGGKTFEIVANGVSDKNRYVKEVYLNGSKYTKGYITNDDILNGGKLEFIMDSKPNKRRAFHGSDRPYSLSTSKEVADVKPSNWSTYDVGQVNFSNKSPQTKGGQIYNAIIPNPQQYISQCAREVLETLYFSPMDSIPNIKDLDYIVEEYDGISAKNGAPPRISIKYSTKWIEKAFGEQADTAKLHFETRGVLYHELTHGFQLEPQGIGSYGTNKTFWAMIEGMADAVRYLNGGFTLNDRPKKGSYLDGYRTTGFFLAWLVQTKDPDFLRKFNQSTLHIKPWSFDMAIKYALGEDANVDRLWHEYLLAMGDIK